MAELDLVLVNPNTKKRVYQGLSKSLTALEPPVWAGLTATFARRKGYTTAIVDAEAEGLSLEEITTRVADMKPLLAAVPAYGHQPSASTQVMPGVGAVSRALKEALPELPVLLLGGHVAALPEQSLRDEVCDFTAGGEGLYTLTDLLACLKAGGKDLEKVRGLYYQRDGRMVRNQPAPLLTDLEGEMPGIAWDLLPMDRYRAHNWHCFGDIPRQPYAALYTTLGCPFHCSFCCIQAPFKSGEQLAGHKAAVNTYRFWSPDTVIREIDTLVNDYGVTNIKIADEMFVLNKAHVLGICDRIIERGYKLNIWAYSRVDTVKPGMLDKLKRAGVNWLALGIEAANEKVRDQVQKGIGMTDVQSTVQQIRDAGIYIIGNYIFGLPEDDLASMTETLDLAMDLNCEFANFYCAMAYPGSQLYRDALVNDWALPKDWAGYSQHAVDSLPLPTRHLGAGEVLRFRDEAFQRYFANPRYLAMVRETFGDATEQSIREMAAVPLKRANT